MFDTASRKSSPLASRAYPGAPSCVRPLGARPVRIGESTAAFTRVLLNLLILRPPMWRERRCRVPEDKSVAAHGALATELRPHEVGTAGVEPATTRFAVEVSAACAPGTRFSCCAPLKRG